MRMFVPALAFAALLPTAAAAAAATTTAMVALPQIGPVNVNVSYNLQLADTGDPANDQERAMRKAMYERAAKECQDLLATIATACQITNISVSTQINRYPGQPPQMYINTNVTMQATLKP